LTATIWAASSSAVISPDSSTQNNIMYFMTLTSRRGWPPR
jgi:hypothetical protein